MKTEGYRPICFTFDFFASIEAVYTKPVLHDDYNIAPFVYVDSQAKQESRERKERRKQFMNNATLRNQLNLRPPLHLSHTSRGLLECPLDSKLGLLELITCRLLNLELLQCLGELRLDLRLCTPLKLHSDLRGGDRALDLVNVSLEVRLSLVLGAKVFVGLLELLSILDHLVDLCGGETADRVGDACEVRQRRLVDAINHQLMK